MATVIESMELLQVLAEAEDIARSVNQRLTSAHQLLAFFTVPNRAEILLRERGIDEDRILEAMSEAPREPDGISRDLRERAREVAGSVGAVEVDCLHLLIAMSRVRAAVAHQLLGACGLQLSSLRNIALSYFTARMPRRLRELQPVKAIQSREPGTVHAREGSRLPEPVKEPLARGEDPKPTASAAPAPRAEPPRREEAAPPKAPEARAARSPSPYALDPRDFPWLSQLGRNLTELAHAGKLDPLIGREREVEEVIDILGKRRTNNPLLVGEPGVGKTALVEGIAQKLSPPPRPAGACWWSWTWRASSPAPSCAGPSPRSSSGSRKRSGGPPDGWWCSSTIFTP